MVLARSWVPRWLKWLAAAAASVYLASVWCEAVGINLPGKILPRPALFFAQVAKLFPNAARYTIEWRARGYRCALGRFEEIDLRPHFPIHADDKENRFDRAMFFYYRNHAVLEALDSFITARESQLGPEHRTGGVMLLSVRIPLPEPGERVARYRRLALDEMPRELERKYWYTTGTAERERRCAESP